MALPIQAPPRLGGRDFDAAPLPSISSREDEFGRRFGSSHRMFDDNLSPSAISSRMNIRRSEQFAPPPLPPPPLVPIEGPIDHSLHHKDWSRSHESPLRDSFGISFEHREPSLRQFPDEGYQSIDSARAPSWSSRSMFRPDDNGIDSSMLKKLDRPAWRSNLSASTDLPRPRMNPPPLSAVSLPHRTKQQQPFLDTALTRSPGPMSTVSPFSHLSPAGTDTDFERSPIPRSRRTNSDDATVSTQESYDGREDEHEVRMETSRMGTLDIHDRRDSDYCQVGQKRRASSPPDDGPLASDGLRRRDGGLVCRGSPTPRLTVIPQGSFSSISSVSRSNSYVSSNLTASSMTSMASFGRRSPLSPGGLSPTEPGAGSPYAATSPRSGLSRLSALQSPRSRMGEQSLLGQGTRPLASPRNLVEIPKTLGSLSASKLKGPYLCECCPKKPKKFDTEEELKAHAAEKQYNCAYCGNRFKNKNEAERHQNSLHVRRHSWSCSALTAYDRAFHDSTTKPGEADTCGYCGDEFPRSGQNAAGVYTTDEDWDKRVRHLQDVHKFRECNSSKKFYRADHFRQHLKHSHAGTSGKWTNMLENACMMEEDPPVPVR